MTALPHLDTERLHLRPFSIEDADEVTRMLADGEVSRFLSRVPHPYEEGMAMEWIRTHASDAKEGGETALAITSAETGRLMGSIGLSPEPTTRTAELGYWLGKQWWGQGYASEAARAVMGWGFDEAGHARISSRHAVENAASGHVLVNAGLKPVARLERSMVFRGELHDVKLLGVTAEQWPGQCRLVDRGLPPRIEGERILLRGLRHADTESMYQVHATDEVFRNTLREKDFTRDSMRARIEAWHESAARNTGWVWGIQDRQTGELVGNVGMSRMPGPTRNTAGTGFMIGEPWWNRGYATEALRLVVRHGFQELSLHRIEGDHRPHNEASGRVMTKAGLIRDGLVRSRFSRDGDPVDVISYAIIRSDWENQSS